jgi:hypothetical protein
MLNSANIIPPFPASANMPFLHHSIGLRNCVCGNYFYRSVFLKSGFWESSRRAVSPYCPENMYPIGKVLSGFFPAFPEYSCESLYAIFILTFLLQLCQRNKDFLTARKESVSMPLAFSEEKC